MFAQYFSTRGGGAHGLAPLVVVKGRTHHVMEFYLDDIKNLPSVTKVGLPHDSFSRSAPTLVITFASCNLNLEGLISKIEVAFSSIINSELFQMMWLAHKLFVAPKQDFPRLLLIAGVVHFAMCSYLEFGISK